MIALLDPLKVKSVMEVVGPEAFREACRARGWPKCVVLSLRRLAGDVPSSRVRPGPPDANFDTLCAVADAAGVTLDSLRAGTPVVSRPVPRALRTWSGPAMRRLREGRTLSQLEEGCKRLGWAHCDHETLRRIEASGIGTRFSTACYVADVLGVSLEALRAER